MPITKDIFDKEIVGIFKEFGEYKLEVATNVLTGETKYRIIKDGHLEFTTLNRAAAIVKWNNTVETKIKPPTSVYAVPWVEIDFGRRPEGYKVFLDKDVCKIKSREDWERNKDSGGYYIGPEQPAIYYEVPWDCVEENVRDHLLRGESYGISSRNWEPKFKSQAVSMT